MNRQEADELRTRASSLYRQYEIAKSELEAAVRSCRHDWGETVYQPEYYPAFTDPGDPPGTMGVDHRGPCYIPERTVPKWKRVCRLCGTERYTTKVKEVVRQHPDWGNE